MNRRCFYRLLAAQPAIAVLWEGLLAPRLATRRQHWALQLCSQRGKKGWMCWVSVAERERERERSWWCCACVRVCARACACSQVCNLWMSTSIFSASLFSARLHTMTRRNNVIALEMLHYDLSDIIHHTLTWQTSCNANISSVSLLGIDLNSIFSYLATLSGRLISLRFKASVKPFVPALFN